MTLFADQFADAVVDLIGRIRGIAWSKGAQDHKHGREDGGEDHQLTEHRAGVAKFLPLHTALAEKLLQLGSAELEENEATEGNAVAERLEERNRVLEQEHGGEYEEDVLEYARKGEDKGRGPADLRNC